MLGQLLLVQLSTSFKFWATSWIRSIWAYLALLWIVWACYARFWGTTLVLPPSLPGHQFYSEGVNLRIFCNTWHFCSSCLHSFLGRHFFILFDNSSNQSGHGWACVWLLSTGPGGSGPTRADTRGVTGGTSSPPTHWWACHAVLMKVAGICFCGAVVCQQVSSEWRGHVLTCHEKHT